MASTPTPVHRKSRGFAEQRSAAVNSTRAAGHARVVKQVDTRDLKSRRRKAVPVRSRPRAPTRFARSAKSRRCLTTPGGSTLPKAKLRERSMDSILRQVPNLKRVAQTIDGERRCSEAPKASSLFCAQRTIAMRLCFQVTVPSCLLSMEVSFANLRERCLTIQGRFLWRKRSKYGT